MNVGQIFETHLGWAARGLGKQIGAMLDDIHARGQGRSSRQTPSRSATKLKDIYGKNYHAEIDARDDDEMMELASNLTGGMPMGTPVFDGAKEADVSDDAGDGRARHVGPGRPCSTAAPARRSTAR